MAPWPDTSDDSTCGRFVQAEEPQPRLISIALIDISPLRESRSFRLLWLGQLVSLTGTQLRLVAIPYQIYLITGSSLDVGLIGLFQAVPLISLALFGGVIADRLDRRRLLVATQIGLAACSAGLAIGTQLGFANVVYLYAFTAIGAAFFGSPRALFPFYADRVFAVGPEGLGLLFAAPGVGSLIAALGSGWTKRVQRQGTAVLLAVAAWGLAIAAFGLMNDDLFLPALLFIAVAQGADTVSAIFRSTILLTVVPDHLRGRLVAISSMFFLGGPYLGQVESGVFADLVSPTFSVVSGGIATLLSVVGVALWAPEVLSYRAPAPELKGTSPDA